MPRRPVDDEPFTDLPDAEETLTDELLELPDDLDLEDPLAHLEAQLGDDEEDEEDDFTDEVTLPLEEIDLSSLDEVDDAGEGEAPEEEFLEPPPEDYNEMTADLEFPELMDEDSVEGAFILEEGDELVEGTGQVQAPVVLPWETVAELPELGLTLPAILDPTMEQTFWMVSELGNRDRLRTKVVLPGVEVDVHLIVRSGRKPGLRVGRDVLAGRVLISS